MYDGTSPSDRSLPTAQRARGRARISAQLKDGRTRLEDLYQDGAAKIRLPRVHGNGPLEAVLLNTAGGLTGGDVIETEAEAGPGAALTVATQACERLYRALPADPPARIETKLAAGPGARLAWLPQETILFDGGRAHRRLEVDMAGDASLLAVESLLVGRRASGETVAAATFRDTWRVRRDGKLVFADDCRLEGPVAEILAGPAVAAGCAAVATVLLVAPGAEAKLEDARSILAGITAGASALNGTLRCRLVAADGQGLRKRLLPLLECLYGGPLPRVWHL